MSVPVFGVRSRRRAICDAMQQLLHVLIVDVRRGEALVAERAGGWLLPILQATERTRIAALVEPWVRARGIRGRMVGQWLGRLTTDGDAVDWLAIVSARAEQCEISISDLRWLTLASFATSHSCVEYQRWAIEMALANSALPSVHGPFGTMTWIDDVESWLGERCLTPYRLSAHEVVLECRARGKRAFFKGLSCRRAAEAILTSQLATLAPESFPKTIDIATRPDGSVWWLMDACPGVPLSTDLAVRNAALAAATYARVQRQVMDSLAFNRSFALEHVPLDRLSRWATELIGDRSDGCRRIIDACERVEACGAPQSWVFMDFDPRNAFVDRDRVRFIDLDNSVLSSAPLGVATFGRRVEAAGFSDLEAVYGSYFESLRIPTTIDCVTLRAFELVSLVLECRLAWKRVLQKTQDDEVYGAVDYVRRRLARRLAE
jgi:hypothetical protein